jgi:hypothetical protein
MRLLHRIQWCLRPIDGDRAALWHAFCLVCRRLKPACCRHNWPCVLMGLSTTNVARQRQNACRTTRMTAGARLVRRMRRSSMLVASMTGRIVSETYASGIGRRATKRRYPHQDVARPSAIHDCDGSAALRYERAADAHCSTRSIGPRACAPPLSPDTSFPFKRPRPPAAWDGSPSDLP